MLLTIFNDLKIKLFQRKTLKRKLPKLRINLLILFLLMNYVKMNNFQNKEITSYL